MIKRDVKIGGEYRATVSGRRVRVRIDREAGVKGWIATNLLTGREVRILTAARLTPLPIRPGGAVGPAAGGQP